MPATTIHTPPKRPIAVSSLKWQPLDIAVGATLGAACGVIFWGFNFAYMPISSVFGAILPGFASIVHAVWYFSGTLAVLILREPGAALYVSLIVGRFGDWLFVRFWFRDFLGAVASCFR